MVVFSRYRGSDAGRISNSCRSGCKEWPRMMGVKTKMFGAEDISEPGTSRHYWLNVQQQTHPQLAPDFLERHKIIVKTWL